MSKLYGFGNRRFKLIHIHGLILYYTIHILYYIRITILCYAMPNIVMTGSGLESGALIRCMLHRLSCVDLTNMQTVKVCSFRANLFIKRQNVVSTTVVQ